VILLGASGLAKAEIMHIVPLERSESIHQYSNPYQTVMAVQENDALQVVVLGSDDPTDPLLEVRRAFLEFTIPSLSGMVTGSLILQKYYDAGYPPVVPFEVSAYEPQADITPQMFDIPATPVTEFSTDYTQWVETLEIEVTEAISEFAGRSMGLRIQVTDEGELGESVFRGAGFEDGQKGVAPWIEIVETTPAEAIEAMLTVIEDLVDGKNLARSLTNTIRRLPTCWAHLSINWKRSGARKYLKVPPMC
jgi:hypothetical protein